MNTTSTNWGIKFSNGCWLRNDSLFTFLPEKAWAGSLTQAQALIRSGNLFDKTGFPAELPELESEADD